MEVGVVVDIIKETERNWRFVIESPLHTSLNYISGQLIQLGILEPDGKTFFIRNYSVASWPDGTNRFEIIVTNLEGGRMCDFLFNKCEVGSEVYFRGPMGVFLLPEIIDRDLYFVATGSGISPFRSMLNYIADNKVETRSIKLFFGTRTKEDIVYYNEMKRLEQEIPNFEYHPVLSREEWSGHNGYVHDAYMPYVLDAIKKPLFYLCGWRGMVDEARTNLKERGYKMGEDIRVEIFG